jgi:hypothetical protein
MERWGIGMKIKTAIFSIIFAVELLTLPLLGQTRRPITFNDQLALKRVADAQIAPDG